VKKREVVKFLEKAGFEKIRSRGHITYRHPDGRQVQVPHHSEIKEGTWRQIRKRADRL